jgi:16S rRNA G966 N2-methylase RsmD
MNISETTIDFVCKHANDDVRKLALSAKRTEGLDLSFALDQIAGRQKARTKLPSWYALAALGEGVDEAHFLVFPPHISMEQCSSEQTAKYKKSVLDRVLSSILALPWSRNTHFIDITGGFGVDFSYIAQGFAEATYVERQEHLCEIARHNFPLLGLPQANVICKELETPLELPFLGKGSETNSQQTVVFIDPARRDTNGNRTYAIGDCTPNILDFIGELLNRTAVVMVKLSPMLDWHQTVEDINRASGSGNAVREVHIVSTQNECKELLLVLSERYESALEIYCVNDDDVFVFTPSETKTIALEVKSSKKLFVPNASVMKAGCFSEIEARFGIRQIGKNSHLFIGGEDIVGFPGRVFNILCVTTMNKKELKSALAGIDRANITTRNFPLSPEQLRKRLKIKDGGDIYLFATTTDEEEHIIYVTGKDSACAEFLESKLGVN